MLIHSTHMSGERVVIDMMSLSARPLNPYVTLWRVSERSCDIIVINLQRHLHIQPAVQWWWFRQACIHISILMLKPPKKEGTCSVDQDTVCVWRHEDAMRKFLPHVLFTLALHDGATSEIGSEFIGLFQNPDCFIIFFCLKVVSFSLVLRPTLREHIVTLGSLL